jgi:hypothetical protein
MLILCGCGCAYVLEDHDSRGRLRRFIDGHSSRVLGIATRFKKGHPPTMKGETHYAWKGGRKQSSGYIKVKYEGHHRADRFGYVYEQIIVMERFLNACILSWIVVHHINHNKQDNRIENLKLMTHSNHVTLHNKERWNEYHKC